MLMQVKDFPKFSKFGTWNAMIWLSTFVTCFIRLDLGLILGMATSVLSILVQSVKPYTCLLGQIPETELFVCIDKYKKVGSKKILKYQISHVHAILQALELEEIKIFHYSGSLNFINEKGFQSKLCKTVGIFPEAKQASDFPIKHIIIDMTSVTFVDYAGVATLHNVVDEFMKIDVNIYLAACSVPVFNAIAKSNKFIKKENFRTFASVLDAVHYCQKKDQDAFTVSA